MEDSVCHAPPIFQCYYKLIYFTQTSDFLQQIIVLKSFNIVLLRNHIKSSYAMRLQGKIGSFNAQITAECCYIKLLLYLVYKHIRPIGKSRAILSDYAFKLPKYSNAFRLNFGLFNEFIMSPFILFHSKCCVRIYFFCTKSDSFVII